MPEATPRTPARLVVLAALTTALAAPLAQAATVVTYDFTLKANTPNAQVPIPHTPFGLTTATPADTFHATLSYIVQGSSATLQDFALTVGTRSWTESPGQTFSPILNADGTLSTLFFRADSDGDAFNAANWQDIVEIMINFGGSTFWRAYEGNCQVGAGFVQLACIQGVDNDNGVDGISFRITTQQVPEPASLALAGVAFAGLAAARRRRR